jgi:RND family efflux transporter MFP subunit
VTDAANTPRLIVDKASQPEPAEPAWADDVARIGADRSDQPVPTEPSTRHFPAARMVLQIVLAIVILAAAKTGMDWLVESKPEGFKRPARERVYTVQMTEVQPADHQPVFTVYGNSVAGDTVDLRMLVSGEIKAVHPRLRAGETIRAGEVLLEVDRFDHEGALTEAEANLQEADAQLAEINARIAYEQQALERTREQAALAERDLERSKDLLNRGSGTQKNVDDRQMAAFERAQSVEQRQSNLAIEKTRADQQRATIRRLQWKTAEARRDLENTRLLAPFDAVVTSASAGLGRNLSANDVVVSLYRSDSLDVRFVVTDAQYGRLLSDPRGVIGRTVEVTWGIGGEPAVFAGTIDRVGAELQSERGGVELFATIDLESSETDIRPGAFVEIAVPDKVYETTVRLPETAVYNGNRVYVIEDGRLVTRTVAVASYTGGDVIISDGLNPGETVLTTQIADARDGLKVVAEGEAGEDARSRGKPSAAGPADKKTADEEGAAARPANRT